MNAAEQESTAPMTPLQEHLVWDGLIDTERLSRYYGKLNERYSRRNRIGMLFVVLLGVATMALPFWSISEWWLSGIGLLIAMVGTWLTLGDVSRRAGMAAVIGVVCMGKVREWQDLWVYGDETQVRRTAQELQGQIDAITAVAMQDGGLRDEKLNHSCQDEAETYWRQTFGSDKVVSA